MSTNNQSEQKPEENVNRCDAPAINLIAFNKLHSKISLDTETLTQRAKTDPSAEFKLKLIQQILAEMNLAKTQHDKDIKDLNTRDSAVEAIASDYTKSISEVCASLKCEGELSDLVLCSAKYQLLALLCYDDNCNKQNDLIQLIHELSLIVKNCDSLESLLNDPSIIDPEKCDADSDEKCEEYLKDSANCNVLKNIITKLKVYKTLDLGCKKIEDLCVLADCNDLKTTLATSYGAMQKENSEYICLKTGCGATTSCIVNSKLSLERLFQVIKGLSANAKNQLKISKTYLDAFNIAITKRNKTGAVLQYCYLITARDKLCNVLNFNNAYLTNDFYDITDIVTSYGACDCSQEDTSKTINDIWCRHKKTYVECLNTLYCKEVAVFNSKQTWACDSTTYNDCLRDIEKNAIDKIEEEIKPEPETPDNPETPDVGETPCDDNDNNNVKGSDQNMKKNPKTAS